MVIITHDMELIKKLERFTNHYYEISRIDNKFSSITRKEIGELYKKFWFLFDLVFIIKLWLDLYFNQKYIRECKKVIGNTVQRQDLSEKNKKREVMTRKNKKSKGNSKKISKKHLKIIARSRWPKM